MGWSDEAASIEVKSVVVAADVDVDAMISVPVTTVPAISVVVPSSVVALPTVTVKPLVPVVLTVSLNGIAVDETPVVDPVGSVVVVRLTPSGSDVLSGEL